MTYVDDRPATLDPTTNLAARYSAATRTLDLVDCEVPTPGPGEVVVKVLYCGVCGTEISMLSDPREAEERRLTEFLGFAGHEYSGTVESVGPDVANWTPGDRVVGLVVLPCGTCSRCLAGDRSSCLDWWRSPQRAYMKYMTVRAAQLRAIPPEVDMRVASLAVPLSECVHAIDQAEWRPGLTALVVGGGAIGLLITSVLVHGGASSVIVTEPNAERRALATELGAIAVAPEEGADTVRRITDGQGVDVSFECVGSPATFGDALAALRQRGRLVLFGVASYDVTFDLPMRDLLFRGLSISTAYGSETTLVRALELLKVIGAERLLGDEFPLTRVNEAFAHARTGHPGKVLVTPWQGA